MPGLLIREPSGRYTPASPEQIAAAARQLRESRWLPQRTSLTSPEAVRDYLDLQLADREREVFCVVFLDTQHKVIAFEELFYGTFDSAAVYPREVVKSALNHNAAAAILAHNHPSGEVTPSHADRNITKRLVGALGLIECRVLDHFIVGQQQPYSFAEHGLL
nr:DNA repair protein RadC [uncultured Halomonas sp.]